jgi:hypothetical protein
MLKMICFIPEHHIYYPDSSENNDYFQWMENRPLLFVTNSRVYLIKLIRSKLRSHDFKTKFQRLVFKPLLFMMTMICFIPEHHIYQPYSSEINDYFQWMENRPLLFDTNLRVYLIKLITSKLRSRDFKTKFQWTENRPLLFMMKMICFRYRCYSFISYSSENKRSWYFADSATY